MSKEAEAYHHKWIGDEKDLRDRYEVMQDYAEKYHKEQLRKHDVVKQSEQLVCDCGNPNLTWYGYGDDKTYFCFECKKEVTN